MFDERSSNANPMQKLKIVNLAHSKCLAHVSQLMQMQKQHSIAQIWKIETSPMVENSIIHHILQIRYSQHLFHLLITTTLHKLMQKPQRSFHLLIKHHEHDLLCIVALDSSFFALLAFISPFSCVLLLACFNVNLL